MRPPDIGEKTLNKVAFVEKKINQIMRKCHFSLSNNYKYLVNNLATGGCTLNIE